MISKERFLVAIKLSLAIIFLLTSIAIIPKVLSRYQSVATANPDIDVAFYIINTTYQSQSIVLNKIEPSNSPSFINFTIANNDGTNRLGVDAEYDLKIITTTNLPLEYKLYRNQAYNAPGAVNIISSTTTVATDSDGTYFKTMVAPSETFSFTQDQQYTYQLVIYFPLAYMSYNYQDIVESIEIVVDSRQILPEDD